MASIEQYALNPGDLIYTRTPEDGVVHTDILWTVDENEGVATNVSPTMRPDTYWIVWVRCDGSSACLNDDCEHGRTRHCFLLSAQDYVHASRLPKFEVQR